MKHTEGYWEVSVNGDKQWDVCEEGGGDTIAMMLGEKAEANAQLIATAPELLSALMDCAESLARLPDVDNAYRVTCLQQAKAAIARATGTA